MRKTMVYLTEEQRAGLARYSRRRGKRMAAAIRDAIDLLLGHDEPQRRSRFVGSGAGPEGEAASEKAEEVLRAYLRGSRRP